MKHLKLFEDYNEKTYDIRLFNGENTKRMGFQYTYEKAFDYIMSNNWKNNRRFEDYKNGTISIICNETGEIVYVEKIK